MTYTLILIPLVAWAISQILKFAIEGFRGRVDYKNLIVYGGMPSAHTALISSLMVAIGLYEGIDSPSFAIVLVIGLIVIYDAIGVRRTVGLQTVAIGQLTTLSGIKDAMQLGNAKGHSISEVFGGIVVGLTTALVLGYDKSAVIFQWFGENIQITESLLWGTVVLITALLGYSIATKKVRRTGKQTWILILYILTLGISYLSVLGQIALLNTRYWHLLLVTLAVIYLFVAIKLHDENQARSKIKDLKRYLPKSSTSKSSKSRKKKKRR